MIILVLKQILECEMRRPLVKEGGSHIAQLDYLLPPPKYPDQLSVETETECRPIFDGDDDDDDNLIMTVMVSIVIQEM